MPKKNLIAIIAMVVSLIAASLTLVFTVGPRVSADSISTLDKNEYFDIQGTVLNGLSEIGRNYAESLSAFSIKIPFGITEIADGAFFAGYDSWSISVGHKVVRGKGVELFRLVSITFPENIEIIGLGSFSQCEGLTSIKIPNTVTSIGYFAFHGCSGLTSIEIPNSVTSIGYCAFDSHSSLTKIYCEASEKPSGWNDDWKGDCNAEEIWNSRTVKFDSAGGSAVDNQVNKSGYHATKPTAPTRDGYTFQGWYLNDQVYDFTTPVTDNITLTAHWEAISELEPESKNNVAAIAGGTAGGAVGLGTIGTIIGLAVRKRRRKL